MPMRRPEKAAIVLLALGEEHAVIWRALDDASTDYNFYSKRTILTGTLAATMLVFLADETDDLSETEAFLSRRLDGVMAFEKAKAAAAKLVANSQDLFCVAADIAFPLPLIM